MLNSIKAGVAPASLKAITYMQLVKAAATARNLSVTYGGVTPLELAFGRRPAELVQLDTATPPQLTIPKTEEELSAGQIRLLAQQSYQEARQSEDVRRDLAQHLRLSSKPIVIGDRIFYWNEDKSKIHSDGSKGGMWLKGKVIPTDGTMVGIDLGTRLLKVNITKLRKDETRPPSKSGFDLPSPDDDLHKDLMEQAKSEDKPAKRISKKTKPDPPSSAEPASASSSGLYTEDSSCEAQFANWSCVTKGKIHVLEVFAGSARMRQCCALTGLKVGIPIDIRVGFDIMTSKGRQMVIREQQPDVVWLAPVCGPWSIMQNINDPKIVAD